METWWNLDINEELLYDLYHVNSENFIECTSVQIYEAKDKQKVNYERDKVFKLSEFKIKQDSEFEQILHKRRSAKSFNNKIRIDEKEILSRFCGLAFGQSIYNDLYRTYPSGGALYPVNIYLAFNNKICDMSNFENNSVFKYNHKNNLVPISKDGWEEISKMIIGNDIKNCQLAIILSTKFNQNYKKYKKIAYRLIQQEAGHIAQNILLTSEYLGFNTIPLGGYYESFARKIVKDKDSKILYVILLG